MRTVHEKMASLLTLHMPLNMLQGGNINCSCGEVVTSIFGKHLVSVLSNARLIEAEPDQIIVGTKVWINSPNSLFHHVSGTVVGIYTTGLMRYRVKLDTQSLDQTIPFQGSELEVLKEGPKFPCREKVVINQAGLECAGEVRSIHKSQDSFMYMVLVKESGCTQLFTEDCLSRSTMKEVK